MSDDADRPSPAPTPTRSSWLSGSRPGVIALGVAAVALVLAVIPYVSPDVAGSQARAYLIKHPEVLEEMVTARNQRDQRALADRVTAAVAANPALLRADPRDPAFGPADAKVTVVEFFDFRCPGCKAVAPDYVRLIQAHPDVRFVFKDWPILDRDGEPVSQYAARAALAAHQQGKYMPVYQALMAEPGLTQETIDRVLAEQGVDMARARTAIASDAVTRHVADIHTTAAAFRLEGTPTFLINGKATAGIAPQEVLAAIEAAKRRSGAIHPAPPALRRRTTLSD